MPTAPIDFGPAQASGSQELGGASPIAMNVVVDKAGVVRRRPGVQSYSVAPGSAVDAAGICMVYEASDGFLYAVSADAALKQVYAITGGVATDISAAAGIYITGTGSRPTVAETEAMLVFACGGAPVKAEFGTGATALLGGSPPIGTHIIANNARLLTNNTVSDLGLINYSGTATGSSITGHETWTGLEAGFFSAESRPDAVVALHENTNEVYAFGTTSMQYFGPDADTVYAPVTTTENGCAAPYSVIKVDQAFAWLDHQRRFVLSDGRSLQSLSTPAIQQTLNDITTVSDCYGYRFHSGPVECLVWTLPTDGRTFAYQVGGGWAQWSGYSAGNWTAFAVLSHTLGARSGVNIVGTTAGRVAKLVNGVTDDLGSTIVTSVTTGFEARDTSAKKRCRGVRLTLKRGESATNPGPVGHLSWRDDLGSFCTPQPVYFGHSGLSDPTVAVDARGVYRQRQWKFEFSGSVDYALARVEEDFDVLSS